jgi:hypothetical protein
VHCSKRLARHKIDRERPLRLGTAKQEVAQGKETAGEEFVQANEAVEKETAWLQTSDVASLIVEQSVGWVSVVDDVGQTTIAVKRRGERRNKDCSRTV